MSATTSVQEGYDCLVYEELDSSNNEAKRLAVVGKLNKPTWILARSQTAGRGRHGRYWQSREGNFFGSLGVQLADPPGKLAQLSFVTALAVAEAIDLCAKESVPLPQLKWPNDILIEGAKVSGVLLESIPIPGLSETWVIIGIGVNLRHHPVDTPYRATDLLKQGFDPLTPEQFLVRLSTRFHLLLGQWQTQGFELIRKSWIERAAHFGQPIRVQLPSESLEGEFSDLSREGALILRLPNGEIRTITAGDVFALND